MLGVVTRLAIFSLRGMHRVKYAVLRSDSEVRQEDIDAVSWFSKWINYDFKEI